MKFNYMHKYIVKYSYISIIFLLLFLGGYIWQFSGVPLSLVFEVTPESFGDHAPQIIGFQHAKYMVSLLN